MNRFKPSHRHAVSLLIAGCVVCINTLTAFGQVAVRPASHIRNDTIDWMKKVADWQLTQSSWDRSVSWERGALHAGLMACYEATKDEKYLDACRQFAEKFNWQLASASHHADNNAVGQVFMELYLLDQPDPDRYADYQSVSDSHLAAGPTFNCDIAGGSETWWWCDALFMAPPGLVRLARATDDASYIDFMHAMWTDTQACLYDTEAHLFYRDINYLWPAHNYNGEKVFWSRGNGWVLAGTARVLQYLPPDDPNRPRYISLLQEMSESLAAIQLPDGYWHSDLLSPERIDNPETSGTGFFTYGIAWGINNGFLDETAYWPTVRSGWDALKAAVLPNGLLGWVQPVGAAPVDNNSPISTDVFGVGAYLLAGSEVLKYRLARDPNTIDCFETYRTDADLQAAWADGDTNTTAAQVSLGDYGDNFLELAYANDQPPYRAQADFTFAVPKNAAAADTHYLSVLVRGNPANAADVICLRLEDADGRAAAQVMTNTAIVQTAEWTELAFPLGDFAGIDRTRLRKLSIGIGNPQAAAPTGQGTLRIDTIRLAPRQCIPAQADFVADCQINLLDFAVLARNWMDDFTVNIDPEDPGTDDLLAHWPLDGTTADAAGHGYDADAGPAVTFDDGYTAQSAYFNGNDYVSYLAVQNSTAMHLAGGATVSAWIKSPGPTDVWASVVTKGLQAWRLIRYNDTDAMAFHFNAAGGGEYQANGTVPVMDNQWHHVCGVYDGSAVTLYVDGQLDAAAIAGPVNTTADPVYIGSRVNNTHNRNWIGHIDDVRIYDAPLSETNILYLADRPGYTVLPDPPQPTDLGIPDGKIDLYDLVIFVQQWAQDTAWP